MHTIQLALIIIFATICRSRLDVFLLNSYSTSTYLQIRTTGNLCSKYGTKYSCGNINLFQNLTYNQIGSLGFLDYISSKYSGSINISIEVCSSATNVCDIHLTDLYLRTPSPLSVADLTSSILIERDLGFPNHYILGIKKDFKKDMVTAYLATYGYYYIVVHDPAYNW